MKPEFNKMGVKLAAVSPNTVEQADRVRNEHGISIYQIADPELKVIDLYGVRHPKGFAGDPNDDRGMRRPLAVPTTILIDGAGTIRWIDQSGDYRVRSDAKRVLKAVRSALKE